MSNILTIKQFIIDEFIPDTESKDISNDLDLLTNGVLDSLAVLRLVAFIEDQFDLALNPDEIDPDNFRTLSDMAKLVDAKMASVGA